MNAPGPRNGSSTAGMGSDAGSGQMYMSLMASPMLPITPQRFLSSRYAYSWLYSVLSASVGQWKQTTAISCNMGYEQNWFTLQHVYATPSYQDTLLFYIRIHHSFILEYATLSYQDTLMVHQDMLCFHINTLLFHIRIRYTFIIRTLLFHIGTHFSFISEYAASFI